MHNLEGAMKTIDTVVSTDGKGLWSNDARPVRLTSLELAYIAETDDEGDDLANAAPTFGELRIGFDESTWNVREHGLIYTDRNFEAEFRLFLRSLGFSHEAVLDCGYSEQGMQGNDYVSYDIGGAFISEARRIFA